MRILVTGASGQLGSYLLRELARQGNHEVIAWSGTQTGERFGCKLQPIDMADLYTAGSCLFEVKPDAIIHAAALASIAQCYCEPKKAKVVNGYACFELADIQAAWAVMIVPRHMCRMVMVSTDLVFDGKHAPYREDSEARPKSVYGRTKEMGEGLALCYPDVPNVVARLSLLFGPSLNGKPNFFDQQVAALRTRQPLALFTDELRTPLDYATAARGLIELAESDYTGILHMGGPERLSRYEMGLKLANALDADPSVFVPTERNAVPSPEPRPRDTSLDSSRWRSLSKLQLPSFEVGLNEMLFG
jgi:dTDP-4-dehydrorhamnose reductase